MSELPVPTRRLAFTDNRRDPAAWAARWGVSREATEILLASDFVDLHLDLEVPVRVYGYDPLVRHDTPAKPPMFWGHTDYPRLKEGGFTGVVYDIATNPFRPRANRLSTTLHNIERIEQRAAAWPDDLRLVRTHADYVAAKRDGALAMWLAIQGGNAFAADQTVLDGPVGDKLHRITIVHLTSSLIGGTSSPLGLDRKLSDWGRELVQRMNRKRILVDLAHSGKQTFWSALDAHDRSIPPIVSHTGVDGVRKHWRNLDDDQIKAIADRGGVVGIMYQSSFLEAVPLFGRGRRISIVDHLEHVIRVVGEDAAAIGTDYDGAITPPADLPCVTAHPLVVQDMLDRGWKAERIHKILGTNYLRVVREVRP
jgi:membrane dipeptidase